MTVKNLKKLLENFNDNDRVVIDNGEREANPANEIIFAYKVTLAGEDGPRPVIVCQTRDDFDVPEELEAQIARFMEENWSEGDALAELMDYGFTVEDFKYNEDRYLWAKETAEKYGLV